LTNEIENIFSLRKNILTSYFWKVSVEMFEVLNVFFNVTNNFGEPKLCKQESFPEKKVRGWSQGSCAAAGYSYLWAENRSGLEEFRNFKRY
jgi:hypothetical protein